TTALYPLALHDALPISDRPGVVRARRLEQFAVRFLELCEHLGVAVECEEPQCFAFDRRPGMIEVGDVFGGDGADPQPAPGHGGRSEEHTSELQSRFDLV